MIEYTKKYANKRKKRCTSLAKREVHHDRIIQMGTLPMHQTYFNKSLTSDKFPSLAAGLIERR